MENITRRLGFVVLPLFIHIIVNCQAEESSEDLYRRTVQSWRSKGNWEPWNEYTVELLTRWDQSSSNSNNNRLQLVGGFEEGILAIEKATVAQGEGINVPRDQTLAQLYDAYGKVLLDLTSLECHQLALDPHTLLIGIESVSPNSSEPSTFLCTENAENALRNAVSLDATNSHAAQLLQTLTGRASAHERKPKEFVAELFNSVADTFDEKLVQGLGYKVPSLVGEAARSLLQSKYNNNKEYKAVLDAGCGTGLAGRYLKPLIDDVKNGGIMIGVDASQKMLDIAGKCTTRAGCGLDGDEKATTKDGGEEEEALYNNLLVLDLEEMTLENTLPRDSNNHQHQGGFDLIVAADVLVYFGNISNLLQTFANLSTKNDNAGLIFSCERATDAEAPLGYRLLPSGRFAHTKQHAVEAARSS
ncbi:hypothetical protein ACHAXR_002391, partial [Thalassiosira sp. AJA248-18]